jgi:hypothetical protein
MRHKWRSLDFRPKEKFFTTNHMHLRTRIHGKYRFVVVIQDDFMKTSAQRFSATNSWVLDSTFKTNQYGLPLYAAIVPNQDGIRIPIFYMLCSNDMKQGHEGLAIELALTHVFESLGKIKSSAIIIHKHKTILNAIQKIVNNDVYCWTYKGGEKIQTGGRVFLCHFHVMKAWSENLFTQVPKTVYGELYTS